jgi:hypothetical protein
MRRIAIGALAFCALVLWPATAGAQTPPTPTASVTPTAVPTVPPPVPECQTVFHPNSPPTVVCTRTQQDAHNQAKSFMDSTVPDATGSKIPMSAYDIGSSSALSKGMGLVWGGFTGLWFAMTTWLVAVGLWVISFAVSFPFASIGISVAGALSKVLETKLVAGIGLGYFAVLLAAFVTGWHLIRGRSDHAAREFCTFVVVMVLAGFLLANPAGILHSEFNFYKQLTGTMMSLGQPQQASLGSDPQADITALKASIVSALVAKPYDLIDWGSALTGRCAAIRNELLAYGPWGDSDTPRDVMKQASECQGAATFNENPSLGRMANAALTLILALVALGLLAFMAFALLVGQFAATGLIAVTPLAVLAALIPKVRALAWRWIEGHLRAVLVVLSVSFLLSFWSLLMTAVLGELQAAPIIEQFLALVVGTVTVLMVFLATLRRIPHSAKAISAHMEGGKSWAPPLKPHGSSTLGLGLGNYHEDTIQKTLGNVRGANRLARKIGGAVAKHLPEPNERKVLGKNVQIDTSEWTRYPARPAPIPDQLRRAARPHPGPQATALLEEADALLTTPPAPRQLPRAVFRGPAGHCKLCGYPLGMDGKCGECGAKNAKVVG